MNLEKLRELEEQVIEPVPDAERKEYKFWRAAHLGSIALNLMRGNQTLNISGIPSAYFFDNYRDAYEFANSFVHRPDLPNRQFSSSDQLELNRHLGWAEYVSPSIVYALDKKFNDGERLLYQAHINPMSDEDLFNPAFFGSRYSSLSTGAGFRLSEPLTLDMIDEYSRAAIQEIFEISVND